MRRSLVFCFILFAASPAFSKDSTPKCAYLEQPAAAPAQPLSASRLTLTGTTPALGEDVHPSSVIGIDVEYHITEFEPDRFELVVHAAEVMPGASKIVADKSGANHPLSQADGTVHLCAPIAALFHEEDVRWPLQLHVALQKRTGPRSSLRYATTQDLVFPSPDLSARTRARMQATPSEDYYLALESIFNFHEENVAAYKECTSRFPDTAASLDAPYQAWVDKYGATFARMEALQMERYEKLTAGTDETADGRVAADRKDLAQYLANESDLTLRRRCQQLHLIYTGDPRDFIGRYLGIVNEYPTTEPVAGH